MVCHLSLLFPTLTLLPFSLALFSPFYSVNLKDLGFPPTAVWMGASVLSANHVRSVLVRAFLQSFVLLCGLGFFLLLFCFIFFFFLLCALQKNTHSELYLVST